ncbi:hypothetical protein A5868_001361, partial [Enterococcus sp. 12F9_DIV0723]|uniref:PTS transporter subunit EIIC n=1 Tax=Enterococcus sp. 12F9_DIV0723 TaxID=1834169 RepID=UPI000B638977
GLAVCMLLAKSQRYKTLGKLSILPSLFGITEPIIFGTPIIMNLKLLVPHVFGPVISLGLAYVLTLLGILPRLTGVMLPTGMPLGVQGFLQGSWRIALFQIVFAIISIFIWYPFFKSLDKDAVKEEQNSTETA